MNLTICFVTSRMDCRLDWLADSIRRQLVRRESPQLIVVDFWSQAMPLENWTSADVAERGGQITEMIGKGFDLVITPPKPTVWQGPHRVTKEDWWAASNARNTAFCLATRPYVAFCDDRAVVSNHWLQSVRLAMKGNYVAAGSYEKRWYMEVKRGIIAKPGSVVGKDHRQKLARKNAATPCIGNWLYSGTFGIPLEWGLAVNGFEELMDSLSFEDVIFGLMLEQAGFKLRYDPRMSIIEDRTPDALGKKFWRQDKGPIGTDGDKSHESLRRFGSQKRAQHPWDLRKIRETVLKGGSWPDHGGQPSYDWYDGMRIQDFDTL